jgi:hypothetical protein
MRQEVQGGHRPNGEVAETDRHPTDGGDGDDREMKNKQFQNQYETHPYDFRRHLIIGWLQQNHKNE